QAGLCDQQRLRRQSRRRRLPRLAEQPHRAGAAGHDRLQGWNGYLEDAFVVRPRHHRQRLSRPGLPDRALRRSDAALPAGRTVAGPRGGARTFLGTVLAQGLAARTGARAALPCIMARWRDIVAGYFENFGAASIYDLLTALNRVKKDRAVKFFVLQISSDPDWRSQTQRDASWQQRSPASLNIAADVTAPPAALFNVGNALGFR